MEIRTLKINDVFCYENNPRNNEEAIPAVMESIKQCDYISPIVVDENHVILAGHTRYEALKRLGYEQIDVVIKTGLTEEQKRKYRLLDNKTAEIATWNMELLDIELDGLDFGELELDWGIAPTEPEDDEIVEDVAPTIDETEPVCKAGDIWQLGRHRLICGDSTDPEVIAALTEGKSVDAVVTDPPYNVNYTGGTDEHPKIQNDNKASAEFEQFLTDAFAAIDSVLKQGGAFYIWHASRTQREFENALNNVGLHVREQLIWVKNALVLGRSDYQWRHEPCFYGWKDGESHYFIDDRTQTTVYEDTGLEFKKMHKDELVELLNNIYAEKRSTTIIHEDKPVRNGDHPTMKPIKLIARLVKNSTKQGEIVLDTFGGSGSTLIACEQLNRKCYTCELDERYCDVIIQRWEQLTGQKAVKVA